MNTNKDETMQSLRARWTALEARRQTTITDQDILKDYFDESLGILDRTLTALGAPRPPDDPLADELDALLKATDGPHPAGDPEMARRAEASMRKTDPVAAWQREVYAMEAEDLLAFLNEELDVQALRKRLEYETIVVTEAGLVGDGKTNNREAFDRLLRRKHTNAKGLRLVFPAGDYVFAGPEGKAAGSIVLEDAENLILEGRDGARIVTSGAFMAGDSLRLERCRNVVVRNLTFDMDPLPFVFGAIRAKDDATATIEIELLPNSPDPDRSYWADPRRQDGIGVSGITIRQAGTYRYIRESGNSLAATEIEPLGERRYRLRLKHAEMAHIPVGAAAVWHTRGRAGEGCGLSVSRSRHILFDRVRQHASDLFSVWLQFSGGIQFVDCDFVPPDERPAQNNADGFHAPRNLKGPYLERCRLFAQADDCLNFYSPASSVADWNPATRELTLLVTYTVGEPEEFLGPGDPVALLNTNDGRINVARALAVESIGSRARPPGVLAACPAGRARAVESTGPRILRVTLDRDVPDLLTRKALGRPATASYLEYWATESDEYKAAHAIKAPFEHFAVNLRYVNGGFIIRNCQFGYNRALGFKCKAGNGVIRNSHFIDQAVLFEMSLSWREGFLPHDIEVTDTRIDWFCFGQIDLFGGLVRGAAVETFMPRIRIGGQ